MPVKHSSQLLLGFPEYREPAQRLAQAAGIPYADVQVHRFPDGESRVRLPASLPQELIFCRTLDRPNSKLIELELATATARELGATHLTLVAPYLCYMRQDMAFQPGEAVSQRIIGGLLAVQFDRVITVDPHLHRVRNLSEAVPAEEAIALNATLPMSDYLAAQAQNPFLIGPDEESAQWVSAIAGRHDFDYAVARKERHGDNAVRVTLPDRNYRDRNIVFVDDMISTGHTLAEAVRQLSAQAPASISVLVTHALFSGDALERLQAAGVTHICSTDSVLHATNRLRLDTLLAAALDRRPPHDQ
ncbi:MAG: ribose-phosphate diphosphokinase [Thiogranum sp.]|nr:ribose-phosphate diphosphokinase [Thiogranum sp.]